MNYRRDGFEVAEAISVDMLEDLSETFCELLNMQMSKLRLDCSDNVLDNSTVLNSRHPQALHDVAHMLRNSPLGHAVAASTNVRRYAADFLSCDARRLVISGPSMFINFPSTAQRKYTYHAEQNWYPKRRNFLNVWAPFVRPRVKRDSFELKVGSNCKDWFYFCEYEGYNGDVCAGTLKQYEIPTHFIDEYVSSVPDVNLGDGIYFDRRTVHRSLDRQTGEPLFALVLRCFDYSSDLTLGSNWAELPYQNNLNGVAEINVQPS